MLCLYCKKPLGPDNGSVAHVFPNSMGGQVTNRNICCRDCNNSFTPHESICAERVAAPSALLGAYRGDGKPISAVIEINGSKFRAEGGAVYEEAPPPSDKGRVWPLPARDERQITLVSVALKQRRLPPEAIKDGRFKIEDAPGVPGELRDPEEGIPIGMSWGDAPTKRVMVKTACELVALIWPELARCSVLERARNYARHGEGDFHIGIDTTTEGSRLPLVPAPFVHAIEVWTRGRMTYLRFTLFSAFPFVGVLTTSWDGPPLRTIYSFDTRDPSRRDVTSDESNAGDFAVRKAASLARAELLAASDRFSEAMKGLFTNRRAFRAEALTLESLYEGVSKLFGETSWPVAT